LLLLEDIEAAKQRHKNGIIVKDPVHYETDWARWSSDIYRGLMGFPFFAKSYSYNYFITGLKQGIISIETNAFSSKREMPLRKIFQGLNFRYSILYNDRKLSFNRRNLDLDEVVIARELVNGIRPFDFFEKTLSEFVELGKKHHFTAVVSYTPTAPSTFGKKVLYEDPAIGEWVLKASFMKREWLSKNSKTIGFHFIDPLPVFHAYHSEEKGLTHFQANMHLTVKGHQVQAKAVQEGLHHAGLL